MTAPYDVRELASAALFAKLQTVSNFKSISRKFVTWDGVSSADRPALRMLEGGPTSDMVTKTPGGVWSIKLTIYACIYWDAPTEKGTVPATVMNGLLAALDLAMRPNVTTMRQDLGNYPAVQDCWIEGELIKDPGDLDGTGLIMAPVKLLLLP